MSERNANTVVDRVTRANEAEGPSAAVREVMGDPNQSRTQQLADQRALFDRFTTDESLKAYIPAMALDYVRTQDNLMSGTGDSRTISPDKVRSAIVEQGRQGNQFNVELLRSFMSSYEDMRLSQSRFGVSLFAGDLQRATLDTRLGQYKAQAENRQTIGVVAANRELFNAISGNDGTITQRDLERFRAQWDAPASQGGNDFRNRFGNAAQQERIATALDALDQRFKATNPPRPELKDGQGNITQETLLRGMGFTTLEQAVASHNRLSARNETPMQGVTRLNNFANTKLRAGEGPQGVANRMLEGQTSLFANAPGGIEKARRDLATAIGTQTGIHNNRLGAPQVTEQNREQVLKNIEATGNAALRDWFVSRYPNRVTSDAPTANQNNPARPAERATNYDSTRLHRKEGPQGVANRMLEGQDSQFANTPGGITQARRDLANAIGVRAGIHNPRLNSEQVNDGNRDRVLENIRRTGNTALENWFKERYPGNGQRTDGPTRPVQQATDYADTRGGGTPAIVARNMMRDSGLDSRSEQQLAEAIRPFHKNLPNMPIMNDRNLEGIRRRVEEQNNDRLTQWFNARYPRGLRLNRPN